MVSETNTATKFVIEQPDDSQQSEVINSKGSLWPLITLNKRLCHDKVPKHVSLLSYKPLDHEEVCSEYVSAEENSSSWWQIFHLFENMHSSV